MKYNYIVIDERNARIKSRHSTKELAEKKARSLSIAGAVYGFRVERI